jgi:hypothetical protein
VILIKILEAVLRALHALGDELAVLYRSLLSLRKRIVSTPITFRELSL